MYRKFLDYFDGATTNRNLECVYAAIVAGAIPHGKAYGYDACKSLICGILQVPGSMDGQLPSTFRVA